jgi:hypothetical protein
MRQSLGNRVFMSVSPREFQNISLNADQDASFQIFISISWLLRSQPTAYNVVKGIVCQRA